MPARSSPNRSTSETTSSGADPVAHGVGPRTTSPTTATHGHAAGAGHLGHAAHDLAVEGLLVEEALGRDDQVGALDQVVDLELVGHHVEPAASRRPRPPPDRRPALRRRPLPRWPARRPRGRRGTRRPAGRAGGAAARPGRAWRPSAARTPRPRRRSRVRTSQAPPARPRPGGAGANSARAPSRRRWWPSRPGPTSTRGAPASTAAASSSPVPVVEAPIGSLPSAPPTSARPEARAISTTAVRPSAPLGPTGSAERTGDRRGAVGPAQPSSVPSPRRPRAPRRAPARGRRARPAPPPPRGRSQWPRILSGTMTTRTTGSVADRSLVRRPGPPVRPH